MTDSRSSLAGNTARNFALLLVSGVCSIGTSIAAGRALHPDALGRVALASAAATMGGGLLVIGLPTALTRFTAEGGQGSARVAAVARLALRACAIGAAAAIAAFVVARLAGRSLTGSTTGDALVVIGAVSGALSGAFGAIVSGLRRFDRLLRVALIAQPATLALTVGIAIIRPSAVALIGAQAAGLVLTAAGTWLAGRDQIRHVSVEELDRVREDIRRVRRDLTGLALVDLVVWQRSEVLILGIVSNRREIAFYGLAYGLVSQATARLPGAVAGVLLPEMALGTERDKERTYSASLTIMAVLMLPVVVLAISSAADAAELLFGSSYRPIGNVASVLVLGGAAAALGTPGASLMLLEDRQRTMLRLGVAFTVIDVGLAFVLGARFGAVGAAAANGAAQAAALVAGYVIVNRMSGLRWPGAMLAVSVVAFGATVVCLIEAHLLDSPVITVGATSLTTALMCALLYPHFNCRRGLCVRCAVEPAFAPSSPA